MTGPKLKLGDVFTVPIDDSRAGVGQIVATDPPSEYYFAIFDAVVPAGSTDIDDALTQRVLFLQLSLDAKLYHRHWTVVAHRPVAADMPLPAFKEYYGTPDRVDVVDYSGRLRRPATEAETELLPYRKTVAPVRLEKALRAKHGLEPWHEAYADLAPDEATTTAKLFG